MRMDRSKTTFSSSSSSFGKTNWHRTFTDPFHFHHHHTNIIIIIKRIGNGYKSFWESKFCQKKILMIKLDSIEPIDNNILDDTIHGMNGL